MSVRTAETAPLAGVRPGQRRRRGRMAPPCAAAVILLLGTAPSAHAGAALVLDMLGDAEPEVHAFDELEVGAMVRLDDDAQITLLHHAACVEQTVRGGVVIVQADGLRLNRAATVVGTAAQTCPSVVALADGDATIGAVILRGEQDPAGRLAAIAPRPRIVTHASAAGVYGALIAVRDGVAAATLPMRGRMAELAPDSPALAVGGRYVLIGAPVGAPAPAIGDAASADWPALVVATVAADAGVTVLADP